MNTSVVLQQCTQSCKSFFQLTKPRVTALIVFTAVIGTFLAVPGMVPIKLLLAVIFGVGMVSGAAAAFNCLIEQEIDARMARTQGRPLPMGRVSSIETSIFASLLGTLGMVILYVYANALTMWLTLATFFGYAVIYTIFLKPSTPQNIVIGGASGAMPPILGWAAVTDSVTPEAMILFLIIFVWTPPHFWALALYRKAEYAKSGLPMLPVTHGEAFTLLHILLYTVILFVVTLIPYIMGMSGLIYLISAILLGTGFLYYAVRLYRSYSDALAKSTFKYSVNYLMLLFAALLLDHYVRIDIVY